MSNEQKQLFDSQPEFELPLNKPSDMSADDWRLLCLRFHENGDVCENLVEGVCNEVCGAPCENGRIPLDTSHRTPRSDGGPFTFSNSKLTCRSGGPNANRNYGAKPDDRYAQENWFDSRASYDNLRVTQMLAGPQNVETFLELFTDPEKRSILSRYLSLIVLPPGGGKTMLMIALLLALNEGVLKTVGRRKRARRVLWLVPERELAKQLMRELRAEVVELGLHTRAPQVAIANGSAQLQRGPGFNDILVACPQSLWKDESDNENRSDDAVKATLSQFDVIIWDECDFAAEQTSRLVRLGGDALKFGVTASPTDAKGQFLQQFGLGKLPPYFVLGYAASYEDVRAADECLKIIPPWSQDSIDRGYIRECIPGAYDAFERGRVVSYTGAHDESVSAASDLAAVMDAIHIARDLEERMKARAPDHWYSPHILVRHESCELADQLAAHVENSLARESFSGAGWRTAIMYGQIESRLSWNGYSFEERKLPEEERSFSAKRGLIHPWFRAKHNGGRCDDLSARIQFIVDMGVRGLNNWPCLLIVDIGQEQSISWQVQLDGRGSRLPSHLKFFLGDRSLAEFVTTRYLFPKRGPKRGQTDHSMRTARDWLHGMDDLLSKAALPTWGDLLRGDVGQPGDPDIDPQGSPFTEHDKFQLEHVIEQRIESDGPLDVDDDAWLGKLVSDTFPENDGKFIERAKRHAKAVITDPDYRRDLTALPETIAPLRAILKEHPKDAKDITADELRQWIYETNSLDEAERAEFLECVNANLKLAPAKAMHAEKMRLYPPLSKLYDLYKSKDNPGILSREGMRFANELLGRGIFQDRSEAVAQVMSLLNKALCHLFEVDEVNNASDLNNGGVQYLIQHPDTKQQVKKLILIFLRRLKLRRLYGDE
jgi:hypothetical protein